VLAGAAVAATPADAQLTAQAELTSDDVYRGVSLSEDRPALSLDLGYEARGGVYAGVALTGALTQANGGRFAGDVEYLGYAWKLRQGPALDLGVINREVIAYTDQAYAYDATELYVGLRGGHWSVYQFYSPNYYRPGTHTLYSQVSGWVRPAKRWRLFAQAGALTSLASPYGAQREQLDVKAGVGLDLRGLEIEVAGTTRGPDPAYFGGRGQNRSALVVSVARAF
jgi:uncharacterized protein (TIGR02001 family)